MSFSFHVINHKFFIFTAEDPPATQRPHRGRGSCGGRRSGTRGRGRGRTGADDESESPPPVASTAAKKTGRDGPRFPPELPPTLLLTERDYTEAETIRTEHQEDLYAFDAFDEAVRKAEVMQSTMINEMGNAFRTRKVDTYTICVGSCLYQSGADCVHPSPSARPRRDPAQHSCEVPDGSRDRR